MPGRDRLPAPGSCSTPSWRGGCSAIPGWRWAPCSKRCSASGWPRSIRPPTGRYGRCRRRCSSTRRSTSRYSSSCATRLTPSSPPTGRPSGPGRSSTRSRPLPRRRRGPTRGGAPPASTRCGPGGPSRSCANCGRRGTRSPARPTSRRAGCWPTRRSSTRPGRRRARCRRRADRSSTGSAPSTRVTPASTQPAGRPPCSAPASLTTASCPRWRAPPRRSGRRPRTAGPSATRPRRPGSPPPGRRSGRSRPRTGCRSRTCSPRTRCAGWPGNRRTPATPEAIAAALAALGARRWQAELMAGPLADAFAAAAAVGSPDRARPRAGPVRETGSVD